MSGIDYFPLLLSAEEQIFMLNDHQVVELLRALFKYSRTYSHREEVEIKIDDPMVKIVFVGLFGAVRKRYDEYRHRCEVNSENARGHGAPKGNQNARKYTKDEVNQAREDLKNGDMHAARVIVAAAVQRNSENSCDS
jgi:hypothetical protein